MKTSVSAPAALGFYSAVTTSTVSSTKDGKLTGAEEVSHEVKAAGTTRPIRRLTSVIGLLLFAILL